MPDAAWYETTYGGRDAKILSLEPGHRYFLADPAIPKTGELLDVGCGTGNFLAAARSAGFRVTGTELDRNAATFAREELALDSIYPLNIAEFASQYSSKNYDVITFFEVLEHQSDPVGFLSAVRSCLRPGGFIALSVPNRDRWLTGPDVLDYPPNHFLRWNQTSLCKALARFGFEVLSLRQQPVDLVYAAAMINMTLRTGLTKTVSDREPVSFREVMQMDREQAAEVLRASLSPRQRVMQVLGRAKRSLCYPLAAVLLPYFRLRGYKASYLYCLARLSQASSKSSGRPEAESLSTPRNGAPA